MGFVGASPRVYDVYEEFAEREARGQAVCHIKLASSVGLVRETPETISRRFPQNDIHYRGILGLSGKGSVEDYPPSS